MKRVSRQEDAEVRAFLNNTTEEAVHSQRYIKELPINTLRVDSSYQRNLNMDKVNKIVRDFCWYLVNPVKVSRRADDTYWIFDGQHTVEAIKKFTGDPEYRVECLVYEGLPYKVENALFSYQTGYSSGISVREEFKACEERGVPDVVAVMDALREAGVPVKNGGAGTGIQRNAWVVPLYNTVGDRAEFIKLLKLSYEFDDCVRKEITWGIWEFKRVYSDTVSEDKLVRLLFERLDADKLRADASAYHAKMGGIKYRSVVKVLADEYCDYYGVDLPRYFTNTGKRGS